MTEAAAEAIEEDGDEVDVLIEGDSELWLLLESKPKNYEELTLVI